MTVFRIPLTPKPQTFNLQLGAVLYTVTARWNTFANVWVLDFADENGTPILGGVPMVTGANLLEQYDYLGFKGTLYAQNDVDPTIPPAFDNLGTGANLYYVSA